MIFETLFAVGFIGFFVMVLMGASHGHGHAGAGHHGHFSFGHGHGLFGHGHAGNATVAHGHGAHAHHDMQGAEKATGATLPFFLSPMNVFSVCLGMGAAGLLLHLKLPLWELLLITFVCGIIFNLLLLRPIFNLFMRFASKPSDGLEGMVAREALTLSSFDAKGKGLVQVTLDGQLVQLLATLQEAELASGVKVARGENVLILDVDSRKGVCTVTSDLTLENQ